MGPAGPTDAMAWCSGTRELKPPPPSGATSLGQIQAPSVTGSTSRRELLREASSSSFWTSTTGRAASSPLSPSSSRSGPGATEALTAAVAVSSACRLSGRARGMIGNEPTPVRQTMKLRPESSTSAGSGPYFHLRGASTGGTRSGGSSPSAHGPLSTLSVLESLWPRPASATRRGGALDEEPLREIRSAGVEAPHCRWRWSR